MCGDISDSSGACAITLRPDSLIDAPQRGHHLHLAVSLVPLCSKSSHAAQTEINTLQVSSVAW